ncbi:MAG: transglutaminase-like domain-containing protein, partial [Chloroflexi bacterium]|nr:transglutaminase-like domain-containing protein [Chloroflexota bacterium]
MIVEQHWLRQEWEREVAKPDAALNLARCALLIAAQEYADLDIQATLLRLDRFAATVRGNRTGDSAAAKLEALRSCWTGVFGFSGNEQEYYDPRNSYLHEVLERRTGIPISLAVVFLEIGWRVGLPLAGVGLPGHFVVRLQDAEGPIFLDPFNGAELLDEAGCMALMRRASAGRMSFRPEYLWPVSKRQIL